MIRLSAQKSLLALLLIRFLPSKQDYRRMLPKLVTVDETTTTNIRVKAKHATNSEAAFCKLALDYRVTF
jgi:hypothetical protein